MLGEGSPGKTRTSAAPQLPSPSGAFLAVVVAFATATDVDGYTDVWAALRFHRALVGRDFTDYLDDHPLGQMRFAQLKPLAEAELARREG